MYFYGGYTVRGFQNILRSALHWWSYLLLSFPLMPLCPICLMLITIQTMQFWRGLWGRNPSRSSHISALRSTTSGLSARISCKFIPTQWVVKGQTQFLFFPPSIFTHLKNCHSVQGGYTEYEGRLGRFPRSKENNSHRALAHAVSRQVLVAL